MVQIRLSVFFSAWSRFAYNNRKLLLFSVLSLFCLMLVLVLQNQILTMKAVITLLFILFISVAALAKSHTQLEKTPTVTCGVVLQQTTLVSFKNIKEVKENTVARLYRSKNYRIKKELSFTTKNNRYKSA